MTESLDFTPLIPEDKKAYIQSRLDEIEADNSVKFLFAIESGSRAWGFPSPDSDFDVRFVYAQSKEWYLNLHPGRDVIELPIDGDWDINGWDVRKAMQLLLKPNPVVLEWLSSPIRYRWDNEACDALQEFADAAIKPAACAPHYYHLARNQWRTYIEGAEDVNLKKYFYTLRPILALRWIRMKPKNLPPMNFQELVNGTDISSEQKREISGLLHDKANSREIGKGARIRSIDALIMGELQIAEASHKYRPPSSDANIDRANKLFRTLIGYKK